MQRYCKFFGIVFAAMALSIFGTLAAIEIVSGRLWFRETIEVWKIIASPFVLAILIYYSFRLLGLLAALAERLFLIPR